jgi:DNA-directed RNA polymerase, mitochondrial
VRSLFSGKLIEKLRAAGSSVVVPKEVEEQVLSELAAEEDSPSENSDAEAEVDNIDPPSKAPRNDLNSEFNVNVVKDGLDGMQGRFVNLVDLFPPLPEKGDFEVNTIKHSQYFFS